MPIITQIRTLFTYTGNDVINLDTAPYNNQIKRVYKQLSNTTNFISYIPGGQLNAFHTLEKGNTYILDTIPGFTSFTIPDAPINSGGSSTPVNVTGLATISIADLRNLSTSQPSGTGFIITDKGREGTFLVDTLDTTTADDNGTVFLSSAGQRFKRVYNGAMNATWFGIIPGDQSKARANSAILERWLTYNSSSHLLLNGNGVTYYFGESPTNRTYADTAYCIGLIDFQGTLEWGPGVQVITESNKVGIHIQRTVGNSKARLINPKLFHDGGRDGGNGADHGCIGYKNNSTGQIVTTKPSDLTGYTRVYTVDYGNYKWSGLNAWGTCHITNLDVGGYPGHGISVFGGSNIRFNGPSYNISGRFSSNNGDLIFIPNDSTIISRLGLGAGWVLAVNEKTRNIGGTDGHYISIGYLSNPGNTEQEGDIASGMVYQSGNSLFADSSVFDGINNANSNGACGIFTTGDEANQNTFDNFRVGNNGSWGVCDSSLLKNEFKSLHGTANGEHFGNNHGAFTNRGDANVGTTLDGHQYREGGNEAMDNPSGGTTYSPGVFVEGLPPDGNGLINQTLFGIYTIRMRSANNTRVELGINNDGQLTVTRLQ